MSKLSPNEFLAAQYGDKRFGIETVTGNFDGFYISEDASIVTEVLDKNSNDITAALGVGAGKNLSKGDVYRHASAGISSITCTAGHGIAVNANPKP